MLRAARPQQLTSSVALLCYAKTMAMPQQVLGVRDVRNRTAEVFASAKAGHVVFAGSHRKAEVAIMSMAQYEQLTLAAEQELAVHNAVTSAEMEGQVPTETERQLLAEYAAGRITRQEYLAALLPEYTTLA